jgi:hypothetical protein
MPEHFAFPVSLDAAGQPATVEQDSLDHIRDQVHVALLVRPEQGSPLRPGWGTPDPNFREQPLDLDELVDQVTELIPGAVLHAEQMPDLVNQALVSLNIYVSAGS